MKKSFVLVMLIAIAFALTSSSCSSDDDGTSNNNAAAIQTIVDTAESGTWNVTYYFDSNQDETSNFNGFQFTFNTDGSLTATNGTDTYMGTWSVTDDSSSSSSSSSDDDIDFNISFTTPPNFEEMTDDWDIISVTSTKIELIDISGGKWRYRLLNV